jgi:CheY-like chemotaxis protein
MEKRKILYVDDDVDDRFFLSDAVRLINPAMKVIEKENGVEAIDYLKEAKENEDLPCLVVLDINMPLLDGKQTLEIIRNEIGLPDLPVVVFTSSQNPNDRILFKSKGVNMVSKPFDPGEFGRVVEGFLAYCA